MIIIYRVSQEEMSVFLEVIVSVILSHKNVYVHVSYSKGYKYLRFSLLMLNSNNRILFLVYVIGGNFG
jgi:hypothetical protein